VEATEAIDAVVPQTGSDVQVTLYGPDENSIASERTRFSDARLTHAVAADGAGTHYVEVNGSGNVSYDLDVDVVTPAENDRFAPNDAFETAASLSEGSYTPTIWGGESDYYRIELNDTDVLDLTVAQTRTDTEVTLYDADFDRITSESTRFSDARLTYAADTTGTYYVEVDGTNTQTTTDYDLDYDRINATENDRFAPNEQFRTAADLAEGNYDPKVWGGESDYYRIELNDTDVLDLTVAQTRTDTEVTLYDADFDRITSESTRFSDARLTYAADTTGTYYVEVDGTNTQTTTDYDLDYDRIGPGENDRFEPNPTFARAAVVGEDTGFMGRIEGMTLWGGEVDTYAVGLAAGDNATLEVSLADGAPDVTASVFGPGRNRLDSISLGGFGSDDGTLAVDANRSGLYYLRIDAAETGTTDYVLQVDRTPATASALTITADTRRQSATNATVTFRVNNTGSTAASANVRLRRLPNLTVVSQRSDGGQFDAGTRTWRWTSIGAGASVTATAILRFEDDTDRRLVTARLREGSAPVDIDATQVGGDFEAPSTPDNATLRREPATRTATVGGNASYDLVLDPAAAGVGADDVTANVSNASVGRIVDTADGTGAGVSNATVADDGSGVRLRAAGGDTSDTGPVTVATLTVEADAAGTTDLRITAAAVGDESGDGYVLEGPGNASLSVQSRPQVPTVVPGGDPVTDPDGDGRYEDVNGDGSLDVIDAAEFLTRFESRPVTDNPGLFNFDGTGSVDILDVAALLEEV